MRLQAVLAETRKATWKLCHAWKEVELCWLVLSCCSAGLPYPPLLIARRAVDPFVLSVAGNGNKFGTRNQFDDDTWRQDLHTFFLKMSPDLVMHAVHTFLPHSSQFSV